MKPSLAQIQSPRLKKNRRERTFQQEMHKEGWELLQKGWPDFLCFNETTGEVRFIEIKRTQRRQTPRMGLSVHQSRCHEILRHLGFAVEVRYID